MVAVLYRPTLWGASASHLTDWRADSAEYLYIRPANPDVFNLSRRKEEIGEKS